jgi:hypothetical protein
MAVLGAAAGGAFPQFFIGKSQTWTPPQDGNVCLHLVGAGGGGYAHTYNQGTAVDTRGGGGGGYCKKNSLAVTTANALTIVVGSGGVAALWIHYSGAGSHSIVVPTSGGNTTVAGNGLSSTLTANGGAAGTVSGSPAGGASANGDLNLTGQSAGYGGGAVSIYANLPAMTFPNNAYALGRSGGLGMGGGRTDARGAGLGTSSYGTICGGDYGGHGVWINNTNHYSGDSARAGDLCGGGPRSTNVNFGEGGGNGGIGGGGGGAVNYNPWATSTGGHGGDGIVLIQYMPW